ncbi:MFS transporter [Arthrobacter castelli]|uniref:MFS transporter n=1 Tax=Arthrobacter castelli TaxID=271431 RepID=UPI000425F0EE|nr:MFS transporter [Arthrobacter castelli]
MRASGDDTDTETKPSLRALFHSQLGALALALLAVELLAGMQAYLTTTITPLIAAELNGQRFYGLVVGAEQVGMFLTMALGVFLLSRYSAARLLVWLTGVTAIGALVGAAAPTMGIYAVGRLISGMAAGALATVSMGAIVVSMPKSWRQLVLAGFSAMWVVTSIVGPVYAAWISAVLSWRWAMVLYLPLLFMARALIARRLPDIPPARDGRRLDVASSLMLASGIALISLLANAGPWWPLVAVAGFVLTVSAAVRLLPAGVFRLRPGRPSAIVLLGILCGVYFGLSAVVAILAHDVLDFAAGRIGLLLTVGGLAWAVTGLICGRYPAVTDLSFRVRADGGTLLLLVGISTMAFALLDGLRVGAAVMFHCGWFLCGTGMGLIYLDTINRVVEQPARPDHISPSTAASATIFVEAITTAAISAAAAAGLAAILTSSTTGAGPHIVLLALGAGAATRFVVIGRVTASPY